MLKRTLAEIAAVTGGRIVRGAGDAAVAGVSTDSRSLSGGELFVALSGENFDGNEFAAPALEAGAAAALVRAGRSNVLPEGVGGIIEVADTRAGLLALAAEYRRHLTARVVAITGSAGKSTTKEITAHLLAGRGAVCKAPSSFNNEIGVPLTILGTGPADDYLVIEIGTNHPGEIAPLARAAHPDAGVITNIGPTHLEGLGSIDGVAREKATLLDHLGEGGIAVLPAGDAFIGMLSARAPGATVTFGFSQDAQVRAERLREEPSRSAFSLNGVAEVDLPLPGRHNVLNALAAAAVAWRFGMALGEIAARLSDVEALPMRSRLIELEGITLLDDSYNANIASFEAALSVLEGYRPRPLVVVAGDMLELGSAAEELHSRLGERIARAGVRLMVAVGEDIRGAAASATRAGLPAEAIVSFASAREAALEIASLVGEGDAVLVKGSRRIGLEAVCDVLRREFTHS